MVEFHATHTARRTMMRSGWFPAASTLSLMTELQVPLRVAFVRVCGEVRAGRGVEGFTVCFAGETEVDVHGEEREEEEVHCEDVEGWMLS